MKDALGDHAEAGSLFLAAHGVLGQPDDDALSDSPVFAATLQGGATLALALDRRPSEIVTKVSGSGGGAPRGGGGGIVPVQQQQR